MCLAEDVFKKSEVGSSKGFGKVHCRCFIQVSGPGPVGLEEMEIFLPTQVVSVSKTGRIKEISATEPVTEMIVFCPLSCLDIKIS